jgi:CTP:molybdopterin cytidylyltransferase MocA
MGGPPRVAALILAAGTSDRMEGWKPLLPLGRATVLARAVETFRQAGLPDVRVVVGHRADEIIPQREFWRVRPARPRRPARHHR